MIYSTKEIAARIQRIECKIGRPKLVCQMVPTEGFTTWCQGCRMPHLVEWQDLPTATLTEIADAIHDVLRLRSQARP